MAVSLHSVAKPTGITSTLNRLNTMPAGSGISPSAMQSQPLWGKAAGRRSAAYAHYHVGSKTKLKTAASSQKPLPGVLYQALVIHFVTPHVSANTTEKTTLFGIGKMVIYVRLPCTMCQQLVVIAYHGTPCVSYLSWHIVVLHVSAATHIAHMIAELQP